jgi:Tfp pilus assembly protein PilO
LRQVVEQIKKNRLAQVLLLFVIALAAADAGFYFLRAIPAAKKVRSLEKRLVELDRKTKSENEQYRIYSSFDSGIKQLVQFKAMLPERGEYIRIIEKVHRIAKEDGVKSASFGTAAKEANVGNLMQVDFSMPIAGKYRDVRKFIYDIETSPLFLNIDNLSLSSGKDEGEITLTIDLTTYMRS